MKKKHLCCLRLNAHRSRETICLKWLRWSHDADQPAGLQICDLLIIHQTTWLYEIILDSGWSILVFGVEGCMGETCTWQLLHFQAYFQAHFSEYFFWSKNKRKSAKAFSAKWGEVPLKTSLPYTSIDWYYGPNVTLDHKDQISRRATATAATIVSLYKMFHSTFHWQTCVLSFSLQFWPDTKQPELQYPSRKKEPACFCTKLNPVHFFETSFSIPS